MANNKPVSLHEEQETLLIPLFAKSANNPILMDPKAAEILTKLNYNFSSLHIPEKTSVTLLLRARKMDQTVIDFLTDHPNGSVIHLGCGLDSRCLRVNLPYGRWYDLDYPEVIELRKEFFVDTSSHKMIASSVTDPSWMDKIQPSTFPTLVVCEGLMMYLTEAEVKDLILSLHNHFSGCHIIFDAFSKFTSDRIQAHPSMQKTGAAIRWGIDDAREIENWSDGIHFLNEWYFSQSDAIGFLRPYFRLMFSMASKIEMANKAHRILYFQL